MANSRRLEALLLAAAALSVATCGGQPGSERAADETASLHAAATVAEPATPGQRMTFLWRATPPDDPRKIVYLLGSVHVARPDFYPLDPAIEEAFDASDALALEVDPNGLDPQQLQLAMIQRALLPNGETLRDRLSADTWASLVAWLDARGLPLGSVSNYEPWFAALLINQVQGKELGLDPAIGVDWHFAERAGSVKPIEALETVEGQIGLFGELGAELQEILLADALELSGDEGRRELDRLIAAWKAGDDAAMDDLFHASFVDEPRAEPLYEALVTRRNESMADAVDALVDSWNRLFVVVGAGHLVGDGGVVALLERRGYKAEQIPARGR